MVSPVSSPAFFRTSAPSLKLSIFPGFQRCQPFHRIGWWENLQESPIFDGKNHGFPVNFPLNQSSDHCVLTWPLALQCRDVPLQVDPFRLDGAVGESENRIGLFLWRLLLHPHVVSRNRIPGYPKWIKMMDGLSWFIIFLDCGHVRFFWVPHVFCETNSKMIGHISQLYPHVFPLSMIIALVSSDKPNSWLLQTHILKWVIMFVAILVLDIPIELLLNYIILCVYIYHYISHPVDCIR